MLRTQAARTVALRFIVATAGEAVAAVVGESSKAPINPIEVLLKVTRDKTTHLLMEMGLGNLLHLRQLSQVGADGAGSTTRFGEITQICNHHI
jgi:hypothetical protein